MEKIIRELTKRGISFEVIENPPIKTVEDGIKHLGIEATDTLCRRRSHCFRRIGRGPRTGDQKRYTGYDDIVGAWRVSARP